MLRGSARDDKRRRERLYVDYFSLSLKATVARRVEKTLPVFSCSVS